MMSTSRSRRANTNTFTELARAHQNSDPEGFEVLLVDTIQEGPQKGLFATKSFNNGDYLLNYRGNHIIDTQEEIEVDDFIYQFKWWASSGRTSYIDARGKFHLS